MQRSVRQMELTGRDIRSEKRFLERDGLRNDDFPGQLIPTAAATAGRYRTGRPFADRFVGRARHLMVISYGFRETVVNSDASRIVRDSWKTATNPRSYFRCCLILPDLSVLFSESRQRYDLMTQPTDLLFTSAAASPRAPAEEQIPKNLGKYRGKGWRRVKTLVFAPRPSTITPNSLSGCGGHLRAGFNRPSANRRRTQRVAKPILTAGCLPRRYRSSFARRFLAAQAQNQPHRQG